MSTSAQVASLSASLSQSENTSKGPTVIDPVFEDDQQSMSGLSKKLQQTSLQEPKPYHFIDSCSAVASLLDSLIDLQTNPPPLFVDLEGVYLGRRGTVSIIQILVFPQKVIYLIDVHTFGSEAFSTPGTNGLTLKMIFESATIPKVFFDVRNDSDALFSHFGIRLAAIQDIQVMEFASRRVPGKFVSGLSKCTEKDLMMTAAERQTWNATKEKGLELFQPERGGSYDLFNVRPLSDDLCLYCGQDVQYLPRLWTSYSTKLSARLAARVSTDERVKSSQTLTYNGHGSHKVIGLW